MERWIFLESQNKYLHGKDRPISKICERMRKSQFRLYIDKGKDTYNTALKSLYSDVHNPFRTFLCDVPFLDRSNNQLMAGRFFLWSTMMLSSTLKWPSNQSFWRWQRHVFSVKKDFHVDVEDRRQKYAPSSNSLKIFHFQTPMQKAFTEGLECKSWLSQRK